MILALAYATDWWVNYFGNPMQSTCSIKTNADTETPTILTVL